MIGRPERSIPAVPMAGTPATGPGTVDGVPAEQPADG